MELQNTEYAALLSHIDDLKKICEKLKLNLNLLEIPIHHATRSRVLPTEMSIIDNMDSSSSSEASSESSSDDADVC